jgi:predicted transcriptional regulator
MKQIMIQLDDATAAELDKVAPGKSRKRSEFLREVIARVLQERLELATRTAYERWPDEAPLIDTSDWAAAEEAVHPPRRRTRRPSSRKRASR